MCAAKRATSNTLRTETHSHDLSARRRNASRCRRLVSRTCSAAARGAAVRERTFAHVQRVRNRPRRAVDAVLPRLHGHHRSAIIALHGLTLRKGWAKFRVPLASLLPSRALDVPLFRAAPRESRTPCPSYFLNSFYHFHQRRASRGTRTGYQPCSPRFAPLLVTPQRPPSC